LIEIGFGLLAPCGFSLSVRPSVCYIRDPRRNSSTYRNVFALYDRAMLYARSVYSG